MSPRLTKNQENVLQMQQEGISLFPLKVLDEDPKKAKYVSCFAELYVLLAPRLWTGHIETEYLMNPALKNLAGLIEPTEKSLKKIIKQREEEKDFLLASKIPNIDPEYGSHEEQYEAYGKILQEALDNIDLFKGIEPEETISNIYTDFLGLEFISKKVLASKNSDSSWTSNNPQVKITQLSEAGKFSEEVTFEYDSHSWGSQFRNDLMLESRRNMKIDEAYTLYFRRTSLQLHNHK